MGIQALPSATVRTLGASQVITDPATVVKELLDNALDAGATSILIEISNNTVDSIQVRDNGHGIPSEDRKLVAKSHCTSKIGGEEDLKAIDGSSLGFRGEALASVAELSESLTISTRVEGEQVAASLKVNQHGDVVGQERVSLPVGTTVKITGFVKAYPVRNQNALRNSEKCLKKIKQILQSYAFARPEVRLSLRVLKAKTDKFNWTYAPQTGGNVEDAALKIIGSACASQCTRSVFADQGFTLQALLPRADAELSKINNIGPFLSVDHRPVSASRGTPKQMVKIFREALRSSDEKFAGVKEPFLYLNIDCPSASYDANVEPAKDDVLFENADAVIGAVWSLFDTVYPSKIQEHPAQQPGKSTQHAVIETETPAAIDDEFFTSLEAPFRTSARKFTERGSTSIIPHETLQELINVSRNDPDEDPRPARHEFRSNMYGCDEEDLDLFDVGGATDYTEADFAELRQAREDVSVSNPWTMAKMHAAARRPPETYMESRGRSNSFGLPTPRPSSPTPSTQTVLDHLRAANVSGEVDARKIGSQSLPPPEVMVAAPPLPHQGVDEQISRQHEGPTYDYTLSSQAADPHIGGTPLSAIPGATQRQRYSSQKRLQQTQINKPFVSPLPGHQPRERVWFDHLENIEGSQQQRSSRKRSGYQYANNGLVHQGELGDLVDEPRPLSPPRRNRDMRDFVTRVDPDDGEDVISFVEARNYVRPTDQRSTLNSIDNEPPIDGIAANPATAKVSNSLSFMKASELDQTEDQDQIVNLTKPSERASKRRRTNEARAMREISGNTRAHEHNPDEDFRPESGNYAAPRRRRTSDGTRLRRTKSANLPLERVPAGQGTHNLVRTFTMSLGEIMRRSEHLDHRRSLASWHVSATDLEDAFSGLAGLMEMQNLTRRLRHLLVERVSDGDMVENLGEVVESAVTRHTDEHVANAVLA